MFRPLSRTLPQCRRRIAPVLLRRRRYHEMPNLHHDFSNGLEGFMTPEGFDLAWTTNQASLLSKLNAMCETENSSFSGMQIKSIILETARHPKWAPIFNYASMAHNNHFYFNGLSPLPGNPVPPVLKKELEKCFSSMDSLFRELIYTAAAMFGPGFVWLVKAGTCDYRVLTTYLAGSPYSGAHWRQQSTDMNTVGRDGTADPQPERSWSAKNRDKTLPPGGIDLTPVLCLNTWEHAWLYDWGHGIDGDGGKVNFAKNWWTYIDWERVASLSNLNRPDFKGA
ncbi:hypothetical protein CP532_2631 [Ophiocordyceps camponoti-leonardi (nom. inval.)]|nr:hypothetical protein CP532_2631 [Ophiocordyceps camponoti-leonardi (nom. inval.)]